MNDGEKRSAFFGSKIDARILDKLNTENSRAAGDIRQNLSQVIDDVRIDKEPVTITRNGKDVAAIIPVELFRAIQESAGAAIEMSKSKDGYVDLQSFDDSPDSENDDSTENPRDL